MNKKVISLILGVLVLVALGGGLMFLLATPEPTPVAPSSVSTAPQAEAISLIENDGTNIKDVQVTTLYDSYSVELVDDVWTMQDIGDAAQIQDLVNSLVGYGSVLAARSIVIDNTDNISDFGFDNPTMEVVVNYNDGTNHTITLGDLSPDGGTRYFTFDDHGVIYGNSQTMFNGVYDTRYYYLNHYMAPEINTELQTILVEAVTITTPNMDVPLILEPEDVSGMREGYIAGMMMTSPVYAFANTFGVEENILSLLNVSATGIVDTTTDPEELAKYGLAEPSATLKVTHDGGKVYEMYIGDGILCTHEGEEVPENHVHEVVEYYVKLADDRIFTVAKDSLPWIEVTADDFLSGVQLLPFIGDVAEVNLTLFGEQYDYTLIHPEVEDENDRGKEFSVESNGQFLDTENFRTLYQLLLSTAVDNINTQEVTGEPDVTMEWVYVDGGTDIVELYDLDDGTTVVSINGAMSLSGRGGFLDKLQREHDKFLLGEEVNTEW